MKSLGHNFIILLLILLLVRSLPIASAQTIYIDPKYGDNRNPGTSPIAPLKSPRLSQSADRDRLVLFRSATPQREPLAIGGTSTLAPASAESQLERIILGADVATGWEFFSATIWQAPLVWQQNWGLVDISVNGNLFQEGCSSDYIDNGQYSWQDDTLYINDAAGNPDTVGSTVTVYVYNDQSSIDVTGWTAIPPAVWQISFPMEPIHVFVDDVVSDQNWWYGPKKNCPEQTGQPGLLYMRDQDGNPDVTGKTTLTVMNTGGWAVASGDFNGDGLQDVVHSNGGQKPGFPAGIYVNYGAPAFSPIPRQILDNPNGESGFGFYVTSAGDVNNDHYDDLLVAMDYGVGKVYLYNGSAFGLENTPSQVLTPPGNYSAFGFGHGIAGNGDINGDDYSDVLIMGGDDSSAYLCVYLGSDSGIDTVPNSVITFQGKIFGGSVCIAGDMNHDNYDEVAVAVANATDKEFEVRVYNDYQDDAFRSLSIIHVSVPKPDDPNIPQPWLIGQVAPAGYVNADEYADLIVGNQWAAGSAGEGEGEVILYLGSKDEAVDKYAIKIANPEPEAGAHFGNMVAGIGDFDRDGHDDIAVGCPYGRGQNGFVAVHSGTDDGISTSPAQIISGTDNFGWSLSRAGDIKDNGQPYLIAGEQETANDGHKPGGAYLYALPCDTVFYQDDDDDGHGDGQQPIMACIQPAGYVKDDADCDDHDPGIHPGAEEACNGVDDNCDGEVDDGCPPPVAEAGPDLPAVEGTHVKLDGSASVPAEVTRQITAYSWTQINGPDVFLSNAGSADPGFMTPPVGTEGAVLVFQLTVEDAIGLTGTDEVTITIQDNGITGFPADVLTFYCANGQPAGVSVQGGANLLNIVPVDPSTLPAANHTPDGMIYGLFDITIGVPTPGTQADVAFYFPSPAESSHVWVRYNASDGWSDFSDHSSFGADRKSIAIHLTDGATGDDDQSANNVIENISGLGVFALQPAGDDNEPGGGGGGGGSGCFISVMKDIAF